jgi:hypothetical protein
MKKKDFILIGTIVAVALVLLLCVQLTQKEGAGVVVTVNGEEIGRYPLSINATYELNGGTHILKIENGTAKMIDADCNTRFFEITRCVNQSPISKTNDFIFCLEFELLVTVYGADDKEDNENDVDFVS